MRAYLRALMLPAAALVIMANVQAATNVTDPPYKVVCYFESWAVYRPGKGKHDVEDIDPDICTHHVYTFAGLNSKHHIHSLDPYHDLYVNYGEGAYFRFTAMKEKHPQIKTMISIGGWNEGSKKYSHMAASAEYRATFVQSVVDFLPKYGFDGLDMDWEYPTQRGGSPQDKENFILLLKELSEALRPRGLLLSAAISAGRQTIEPAYDLEGMAKYLDFMNVMNYDYHGDWDSFIGHNSPLYLTQKDIQKGEPFTWFSVNYTMNYYLQQGVNPSQLMMGFPLYGRGFKLRDSSKHEPYDPSNGPMDGCPYSEEAGFCGYNELCEKIFSKSGWTDVRDDDMKAIYSYKDSTWIGWDDVETVKLKLQYLKSIGVGGAMLWSIDTDDFLGLCGPKYALTNLIWSELNG